MIRLAAPLVSSRHRQETQSTFLQEYLTHRYLHSHTYLFPYSWVPTCTYLLLMSDPVTLLSIPHTDEAVHCCRSQWRKRCRRYPHKLRHVHNVKE